MKAVQRMQLIANNAEFFDQVSDQALLNESGDEAGEVMVITKQAGDDVVSQVKFESTHVAIGDLSSP